MNTLPLKHMFNNVTVIIVCDNARSPSESVTFRRKRTEALKIKSWDRFDESSEHDTQPCPPPVMSPLMKTAGLVNDSLVLRKPVRRTSAECKNSPCRSSPRKSVRRTSAENPTEACAQVKKSYAQAGPKKPIRKLSVDCNGQSLDDMCAQVTAALQGPSKLNRRQSGDSLDDADVDEICAQFALLISGDKANRKQTIRRTANHEDDSRSKSTRLGSPVKRQRASIESFVLTH